ncbi:hypothetical protein KQI89_07315 [Clostridium sp. MSJ-4]|uniref:Transposase n=1 Tax=Clostridium simiarum TaxID=2841506 RepID=A0ABS6EZA7_9CLOT|nr:hypothetical protein [Clostridium simiarum]MBU5591570.1 hypothetical protein [Clostridium simiarum]
MGKVEGFQLDNTKVVTAYIRKYSALTGKNRAKQYNKNILKHGLNLNIYGWNSWKSYL